MSKKITLASSYCEREGAVYRQIARQIADPTAVPILAPLAGRSVLAEEPALDPFWLREQA